MRDGAGIEGLRFTHPLRNKAMRAGLGYDAIVRNAMNLLFSISNGNLAVQRMVRVVNDDLLTFLVMGSMRVRHSAGRRPC